MADIEIEFAPPLARIKLNRPDRRNAMSMAMWLGLADAVYAVEENDDVRVLIVEGAGGNFCAGADIFEFDTAFADVEAARKYLAAIEKGLTALAHYNRPTIALFEGSSIGGGLAIGLCCDLRFCAEDAHLAVPPAKLGLLYGPIETRRLVQIVGPARAKDMLFSGRRVETGEALMFGLISRRLAAGELRPAAETYAQQLATLSQTSICGAKAMVNAVVRHEDDAISRTRVEEAAMGADFKEGRAAFAGKRKAEFG